MSGPALKEFENLAYFAASVDSVETNTRFAEELNLDYPILSDPGKETAKAFGVVSTIRPFPQRWTFFIDPEGKITKIDKKVKPGNHGEAIVEALKEMGVE